jgi:uncharacterized membrane protein
MKTLCTILIVILTVVLGSCLTSICESNALNYFIWTLYKMAVITVFYYGVYKILESFEE